MNDVSSAILFRHLSSQYTNRLIRNVRFYLNPDLWNNSQTDERQRGKSDRAKRQKQVINAINKHKSDPRSRQECMNDAQIQTD